MAYTVEGDTHLLRQDLISDEKNEAEGAPEKETICLGWLLNTRQLLISLPTHKYNACDTQIYSIITAKSVNYKVLDSILGCLENVAIILVIFVHFINNI